MFPGISPVVLPDHPSHPGSAGSSRIRRYLPLIALCAGLVALWSAASQIQEKDWSIFEGSGTASIGGSSVFTPQTMTKKGTQPPTATLPYGSTKNLHALAQITIEAPGRDWDDKLLIHTSVSHKYLIGIEYLFASFAMSQDLNRTKLLVWIDQRWEDETGSYASAVAAKYRHLPWIDFVRLDQQALMEGSCWENRPEWTEAFSDDARRMGFAGRFWSDLLRVGLLWHWGGFWVDADTMLFFDFQHYAKRHYDNFMVGCEKFDASKQPLRHTWCVNEIMMAQSKVVRDQIMEFSCMVSVNFKTSVIVRPTKSTAILKSGELLKKEEWVESYDASRDKESMQDLWNAGVLLLCYYAKRAGTPEGDRCNYVWFSVRYVDPTYVGVRGPFLPAGKHPVYHFCETAYYPPEYLLQEEVRRFRTESMEEFLKSDKVPLLTHTHQKYCRTHRAKPAGFMRVLGARLESFLGNEFAYVGSAPIAPTNWAFVRADELPLVLPRERRDYVHVQIIVVSVPGHHDARARWRKFADSIAMESPFEKASRLAALSFVIPYEPGVFPEGGWDRRNVEYPDARLESEVAVFHDTYLVPGKVPDMKRHVGRAAISKKGVASTLQELSPWVPNALRTVLGQKECSICVVVLDDNMLVSQVGVWNVIDNELYKDTTSSRSGHFQRAAAYGGHGIFLVSRGVLSESDSMLQELDEQQPAELDESTSFGRLAERIASGEVGGAETNLRLILSHTDSWQSHKATSPVSPRLRLEFANCRGVEDLGIWKDVLAIGPEARRDSSNALKQPQPDDGPMSLGSLGWHVMAAWEAGLSGHPLTGPCLLIKDA